MASTLIQRMRAYVAASDLTGNGNSKICCDVKEAADEIERLRRERDDWHGNFSALENVLVGNTGLSAIMEATRLRKLHPLT